MALKREQIEHLEYWWKKDIIVKKPWKKLSHSRKWLKQQMNKYIRLNGKKISDDEQGSKIGRKPLSGWEY